MLLVNSVSKSIASFVLLLFSTNLLAQDFELIKIQSAYYSPQTIEESAVDGEIGFFEWGVQVAIPQLFKKNKKTILIHRLGYGNLRVDTEANPSLGAMVEAERFYYHTISYNLGLVQTLHPNWRLVGNFAPTLASDFGENLSGDDLLYQANAFAVNTKNEKLKYGFGLAYTTLVGRQLIIPVGLLKYNTSKFELDIVLPNKLDMMFKTPRNILSYGLKAGLNGGLFNNASEVQTASSVIDKVGYSRLVIGPAVTLRACSEILFCQCSYSPQDSVNIGANRPASRTFYGSFIIFDQSAAKITPGNRSFNDPSNGYDLESFGVSDLTSDLKTNSKVGCHYRESTLIVLIGEKLL